MDNSPAKCNRRISRIFRIVVLFEAITFSKKVEKHSKVLIKQCVKRVLVQLGPEYATDSVEATSILTQEALLSLLSD